MSNEQKSLSNDLPAALGGAPVFVQTGKSQFPELDRWQQITDEEARVAYEMTLRNELSGGTPVVRQFEQEWREMIGSKYAITTMNGTSALYSAYFGVGVGPGFVLISIWICFGFYLEVNPKRIA